MANLFTKLFSKKKEPESPQRVELLSSGQAFSAWNGNAYSNDVYRAAVDSIARNAAKLRGLHVIRTDNQGKAAGDDRLNRLLQTEPNPYMNAYDLLYKLITHYYLYNNAFALLQRDNRGGITAIYPLNPNYAEFLLDRRGMLLIKFVFPSGRDVILDYRDVIHIRRNFNENDLLGDNNAALWPVLQLAHTQNEGMEAAIKSGAYIRGIMKIPAIIKQEDLKEARDRFVNDFMSLDNTGGVAAIDNRFDYIPLDHKGYSVDPDQLKEIKDRVYSYLGISEAIVNSSYDEDQWAAFYESVLEPLAVLLSLEFTRKIFNDRERLHGNEIIFESGRMQFTSNQTKIKLIETLMPYGLLSINQALDILNLPSVADGEKRLQTLNVVDSEQAAAYQAAKAGMKAAMMTLKEDNKENEHE